MSEQSSVTALLTLLMASPVSGCGDPGEVQVPLIPERNPTTTPTFARAPAQAFTSVGIQAVGGVDSIACPLDFAVALGDSCERDTSGDGTCRSVRDRRDGLVSCIVRPRTETPDLYDVDLLLEHALLPRLSIVGTMSEVGVTRVTLQVATPEQVSVTATCVADSASIQPGAVQLRLRACAAEIDETAVASCDVSLNAGFENCAR
jgi:hypothetical protein